MNPKEKINQLISLLSIFRDCCEKNCSSDIQPMEVIYDVRGHIFAYNFKMNMFRYWIGSKVSNTYYDVYQLGLHLISEDFSIEMFESFLFENT